MLCKVWKQLVTTHKHYASRRFSRIKTCQLNKTDQQNKISPPEYRWPTKIKITHQNIYTEQGPEYQRTRIKITHQHIKSSRIKIAHQNIDSPLDLTINCLQICLYRSQQMPLRQLEQKIRFGAALFFAYDDFPYYPTIQFCHSLA